MLSPMIYMYLCVLRSILCCCNRCNPTNVVDVVLCRQFVYGSCEEYATARGCYRYTSQFSTSAKNRNGQMPR